MDNHPQINAFLQAAAAMRENRYWARNPHEQLDFLGALRDVLTEVCYHLDRNEVLNAETTKNLAEVAVSHMIAPWPGAIAECVLMPAMEDAIQRSLAAVEGTDNTGEDPTAWSTSLGPPAPSS